MLVATLAAARADDISVWFAPSASKVMRDAAPVPTSRPWTLAAARNEVESCQLVLLSDKPIANISVSVSPLQHGDGKSRLAAELFKVEYVPVKKERIPFPDPLPPLVGPLALQPRQAQPVWISVRVPKTAAPGVYRATVQIAAGKWKKELPLSIEVWDFTLPDMPACATAFGLGPAHIAERHGVKPDSPEARAVHKKYYEFMLDHRVSPQSLPVDLMSNEAVPYLNDPRMTSYCIPYPHRDNENLENPARVQQSALAWRKVRFLKHPSAINHASS